MLLWEVDGDIRGVRSCFIKLNFIRMKYVSIEYVLVFDVVKINIGNVYYFNIGVFMVLELGVYVFIWIFWIGVINDYSI